MSDNDYKSPETYLRHGVKYDDYGGGYIWSVDKKGHHRMVMDIHVRGWGEISNHFETEEEAIAFQDSVGKFIADAINEKLNQQTQSDE